MTMPAARRKPRGLVILIVHLAIAAELTMASSFEQLLSALPAELDGWKKTDPERYTKSNLYDYIDGGAELYISYNFQGLLAVRYKGPGDEEIVVDIFDMGDSFNAFGVFSHGRESEDGLVGQGSEYNSGLLTFWKDRYYVSIMAYPETAQKKQAVLDLGRRLAEAVPDNGTLPPVLALLPRVNLIPGSVRYFHHYIWLNSHFFISNENILGIDDQTQAVLAKYREGEAVLYLLIAAYPDIIKAGKARESFLAHYLPGAKEGMAEKAAGKWTGCRLRDTVLSVVFQAPSKETLTSYLRLIRVNREAQR
jgi:hypothetical protein